MLQAVQYHLMDPVRQRLSDWDNDRKKWVFLRSIELRCKIWNQLATQLEKGVRLEEALDDIRKRRIRIAGKGSSSVYALSVWREALEGGASLHAATKGWVSPEEEMLIAAGQQSGQIHDVLRQAVRILGSKRGIVAAIRLGVTYPSVLGLVLVGLLMGFSFFLVPMFQEAAPNITYHGAGAIAIKLAEVVRGYGAALLGISIAGLGWFIWSLPNWDSPTRVKLDKYAPYSIYRIVNGSTWLIAFSSLIGAGMRIEDALKQLTHGQKKWMRNRLTRCQSFLGSGMNIGDALSSTRTGFPDEEIIDDIMLYGRYDGFDKALRDIGETWIDESVKEIQARMRVVLMIGIVLVIVTVLFFFMSLFSMNDAARMAMTARTF